MKNGFSNNSEARLNLYNKYIESREKSDRWVLAITVAIMSYITQQNSGLDYKELSSWLITSSVVLFLLGGIFAYIKTSGNTKFYWSNYKLLETAELVSFYESAKSSGNPVVLGAGKDPISSAGVRYLLEEFREIESKVKDDTLDLSVRLRFYEVSRNILIMLGFILLVVGRLLK